jgi:glutamate dehydrogenase (NAD(P)+)
MGRKFVAAPDARGAIVDENGLDLATLVALNAEGHTLHEYPRGRKLDRDAILMSRARSGSPWSGPMSSMPVTSRGYKRGSLRRAPIIPLTAKAEQALAARVRSCCPISSPMPAVWFVRHSNIAAAPRTRP